MTTHRKKGTFTFKTTGVLLFISVILELLRVSSEVTLFGIPLAGSGAVMAHLANAAIFGMAGAGLLFAAKWGPFAVYFAAAFNALDMLSYILNRKGTEERLLGSLDSYGVTLQASDIHAIMSMITISGLVLILSWIGFAIYTYLRRDYFRSQEKNN